MKVNMARDNSMACRREVAICTLQLSIRRSYVAIVLLPCTQTARKIGLTCSQWASSGKGHPCAACEKSSVMCDAIKMRKCQIWPHVKVMGGNDCW